MAWLPSVITLILSILSQYNASDWIAAHPNVAVSLATLGGVINHLLPSPVSGAAATGTLRAVVWLLLILPFLASPAHAFDVSITGAQVQLGYTEPTQNKTGTPLTDLGKTTGYYQAPIGSAPVACVTTPASSPAGGRSITALCVVPIFADQEADARFTVTASDTSGNESAPSIPIDRRLDFLAPDSPK